MATADSAEEAANLELSAKTLLGSLNNDLQVMRTTAVDAVAQDALREGFRECSKAANDAVAMFDRLGDKASTAAALTTLASVYIKMGSQTAGREAVNAMMEALQIFKDLEDFGGYFNALIGAARASLAAGNPAHAMRHANEARELCYEFDDADSYAMVEEIRNVIREYIAARDKKRKDAQCIRFPVVLAQM
mmetsp:Transcript_27054/g.62536  ORF Transcript_27054/g.62536 Transcript_27054/m.62536 type:complete len:191 (-) Transcript_27054:76-648(-)